MPQRSTAQPSASSLLPACARSERRDGVAALVAAIAACADQPDAMKDRIKSALVRAVAGPDLLKPEQRTPQAGCYARHVLHSDASGRFTIVAIIWDAGQFSPPHAHDTWCAYAVYENSLEESLFCCRAGASQAEFLRTEIRHPGYSCYAAAGLDQIHRLGNSGAIPAISIHVYGVERERIATHVNRVVDVAS